jgi:hypothetical protein
MNDNNINDVIITKNKIAEIQKKESYVEKLKRHENLWFKNIRGVRKANITYAMTQEELDEYTKCKMSVHYFAQNYCKIKGEDGTIGHMKLRDYQEEIIDLFNENRFSLLMCSRQTGKCFATTTRVSVFLINKNDNTKEFYENILVGNLYYKILSKERNLIFLEKVKYLLYKLYDKLD